MLIPILVADSNREFGILIRQVLEESGRFEVSLASSVDEAVSLAQGFDFRLAIIDFALPDIEGQQVVERLRALQPGLAVIGIPVEDDNANDETRQAGVDGILTKPFYLPSLPDIVEEALASRLDFHRPPPPLPSWPKHKPAPDVSEPANGPDSSEPPGPDDAGGAPGPDDEPPPWLTDVDRAAQYLARLTLATSAEAALIIRHRELIAFAGQLPRSQLQELTAQVADSWAEEGRSGSVARFVHLPGIAEDFMLYATEVVGEMVLSLVFSAEVPFGMIRRQAESLAHALSQIDPAQEPPEPMSLSEKGLQDEPQPFAADPGAAPGPQPGMEPDGSAATSAQPSEEQPPEEPPTDQLPHPEEQPPEEPLPEGQPAQQSPLPEESLPEEQAADPLPLPDDWIPQPDQPPPNARLLEELAALVLPEPDPSEHSRDDALAPSHPPRPQTPDLPLDWLPMITHSERHLPFLDDPEPAQAEPCPSPPAAPQPGAAPTDDASAQPPAVEPPAVEPPAVEPTAVEPPAVEPTAIEPAAVEPPAVEPTVTEPAAVEPPATNAPVVDEAPERPSLAAPPKTPAALAPVEADPRLPFTIVFAPRFPEHRLAGPLVGNLRQWTRRLCLAWDWKAEQIDVSDDAFVVQVLLPPDVAPAGAAQALASHLSRRILESFPHLEAGFPTEGFWATSHMLASGRSVSAAEVAAFVAQLRQAQGLSD